MKAVVDEVDVELAESSIRTDADIARSAQNAIEWITYLPVARVEYTLNGVYPTGEPDATYLGRLFKN